MHGGSMIVQGKGNYDMIPNSITLHRNLGGGLPVKLDMRRVRDSAEVKIVAGYDHFEFVIDLPAFESVLLPISNGTIRVIPKCNTFVLDNSSTLVLMSGMYSITLNWDGDPPEEWQCIGALVKNMMRLAGQLTGMPDAFD
jgi:hypothetical protein